MIILLVPKNGHISSFGKTGGDKVFFPLCKDKLSFMTCICVWDTSIIKTD